MINLAYALSSALPKLASAPSSGSICTGSGTSSTCTTTFGSTSSNTSLGSSITSVLPIASIVLEVLALFVVVAVVGLFIIIVVANRADPDATGRRPQSVYFFAVSFVTLITTIVGSIVVVFSVVELVGRHGPIANEIARAVVIGGLITVLSGALLWTHLRRGVAIVGAELSSPTRRVAQSYVSAVSFISVLILLVTTILTVYLLFALGGPGVFGSFGGRTSALRDLIDAVYIGLVAGTVLVTHRNLVTPRLQLFGSTKGRHASDDTTPLAPAPTPDALA
jgi:hypothetical protein